MAVEPQRVAEPLPFIENASLSKAKTAPKKDSRSHNWRGFWPFVKKEERL